MDFEKKLEELQNIDWNDFSQWPMFIKGIGAALIGVAILFAGYWFIIQGELDTYASAQEKETQLKTQFKNKKASAINLSAYRQQMADMKQTFGSLLRQLPNSTEVPSLLVDITQAGLGQGLIFKTFKPAKPQNKDFYAVLPINLKVTGNYHQLAGFVSDVAGLPRIVTIDNIKIDRVQTKARRGRGRTQSQDSGQLTMTAVAYTYRYLTPQETAAALQAQATKRGGKRTRSRTSAKPKRH